MLSRKNQILLRNSVVSFALVFAGMQSAIASRDPAGFPQPFDMSTAAPDLAHSTTYRGTDIHDPQLQSFPQFMVIVQSLRTTGETSYCTGSALAQDVIITAGHCLINAKKVSVQIIRSRNPVEFTTVSAKSWKAHPKLNGGRNETLLKSFGVATAHEYIDLGLIVLNKPSELLEPLVLAPTEFDPLNPEAWMIFFGRGRDHLFQISGKLEYVSLVDSRQMAKSNVYVSAFPEGSAWCVGDSGGPVTVAQMSDSGKAKHFLVGVAFGFMYDISPGNEQALIAKWSSLSRVPKCGASTIYLHLHPYLPWIQQTLGELLPTENRLVQIFGQ